MIRQNRFMKKLLGILLTIALVTGSVFGSGTVVLAEGETKAGGVTKVACVGDSLTDGYKASGNLKGAAAYPARLQSLLGSGYEVKNYGKTSYALMKDNEKSYWNTEEFNESTAYDADIVIIMLGTNDSKTWNKEKYKTDAVALYENYKTETNSVIFATSPKCFVTDGTDITAAGVDEVYEAQKELIDEKGWESIDMYARTAEKEELYNEDKVHFTDDGYLYVAECMYEAITGKKAPSEEKTTIPHTKTSGGMNYFTFAEEKWESGNSEHIWSKTFAIEQAGSVWYEVKFTGHKIDIYSGKNYMMGKVKYTIDGNEDTAVIGDLYNVNNINSTLITTISGLSEGEHTLRAVATGERNTAGRENMAIDCAKVDVYTYREPKEAKLHGAIVDNNLQYTQDKFAAVETADKAAETLTAWKNDTVTSEISLAAVESAYANVKAEASDFTGADGAVIAAENIDLKFIKSVDAYTGMQGYGDPTRPVPTGDRAEANEVLYQDAKAPMDVAANKLQNIWVSVNVPKGTTAGTYTGTVTVTADNAEALTFTYTLKVADAELPDAAEFKDGFDMELWQNPYRVAEYYHVEPFSKEHFEILKPHMELYKAAGGHAITTTIIEEAWAGQTYGEESVKFPSMVKWTKKTDGSWEFDYTDFDQWVQFNKELGIGDKIICYSIAPWLGGAGVGEAGSPATTGKIIYYDEKTGTKKKELLTVGSEAWKKVWTTFLNDLANHVGSKGWFSQTYIGIDERGFSNAAFDMIESITYGTPYPEKLKSAGAFDAFVNNPAMAVRVDDLNVGSMAIKANPEKFEEVRRQREELGKRTTVYTCTGHKPGSFSLSAPGESYWTMMYSYSVGGVGYLRWAYDSWVADPLKDTTHNAFEAGDCFLVFPDDSDARVSKPSTRFAKMAEGVRDVNKLMQMKKEVPSMTAEVDALMNTVKPRYAESSYYLTADGKKALADDMNTMKSEIARLTEKYIALKNAGVTTIDSVTIDGEDAFDLPLGKTKQLTAKVLPENVLNNTVTWTSGNPTVAVVSKNGLVTGKTAGSAVIKAASVADPTKTATVTVNVTEKGIEADAQVSYYSFDEEDGTDAWGNRNGTIDPTAGFEKGKSGNALSVKEAGKGAVIADYSDFDAKSWTVTYWVKATTDFDKEISVLEDSEKKFSLSMKMAADRDSGFRVGDNGGDVLTSKYDFVRDRWYHIAWTQDKSNAGFTMYVNGQRVGNANAWTKNNNIKAPFEVIGGTGFTGLIDEVKIYNRVLTPEEILVTMKLKGLNITDTNPTVGIGESYQITTNLVTDSEERTIKYTSDNEEVASVDENGVVTAHKKGTAVITVTGGGYTEEVTVNCTVKLYPNSRIPQYELADKYLKDIEKAPNTPRQYLGQPDMVRTKTGRLITAYPTGHGHGPIVMQISDDNGETWKEKTDIPDSFETCQETPTMYTLTLPDGTERIMLISACPNWDLYRGGWDTAYSDDNGNTWTEYQNHWPSFAGESKKHTIVAMASLVQLKDDNGKDIPKWMGIFHDYNYVNYKTYLTFEKNEAGEWIEQWSEPETYLDKYRTIENTYGICEVGMFRSPDGSRIMALARSDKKPHLSVMFYSDDEGTTWSEPIEMQGSLAGERHKAMYDPISGRLLITFREIRYENGKLDNNWMAGEWVAWVGTYEDLLEQNEGEYRILIEQDYAMNPKSGDTGYAGILVLEDGTFIMDSYGHFDQAFSENYFNQGNYNVRLDLCYIKQAKFKLGDIESANGLVNKDALSAKIEEVKDLKGEAYTGESYAAFADALSKAQAIFADTSVQQIQVDAALEALTAAHAALAEKPAEKLYHVTVENGTIAGGGVQGDYPYNTKLTVTAGDPETGKVFAGWEVNDTFVSVDKNYTFFVGTDLTLRAVYAIEEEKPQIEPKADLQNVTVTKRTDGKYDIRYLVQLVVPNGYTIKEAGLVWRTTNNTEDLVIGGNGVKVTNISKISNTYQYSVTIKGVPGGNTVPGAAFAKFADTSENITDYYYSASGLGVTN